MSTIEPDAPVSGPFQKIGNAPQPLGSALLLISAMAIGLTLGVTLPASGNSVAHGIDGTLLMLIFFLFFELRLNSVYRAIGNLKFLAIAWGANFLIVPAVGYLIASLVLGNYPILFAGLMIYFLAPCTDWFLAFTRMARGDTELGAVLIPLNLITQLLLFPVWLWLLLGTSGIVDFGTLPGVVAQWFLLPFLMAQALRFVLKRSVPSGVSKRLQSSVSRCIPLLLALLIAQLFAANAGSIVSELDVFARVAVAVFLFFLAVLFLGTWLSRLANLAYPQRALLAMTLAARNAPMMLAATAIAVPDQPLIIAALVFGMLVEIPHLTVLKHWLLRQHSFAEPSKIQHTQANRQVPDVLCTDDI